MFPHYIKKRITTAAFELWTASPFIPSISTTTRVLPFWHMWCGIFAGSLSKQQNNLGTWTYSYFVQRLPKIGWNSFVHSKVCVHDNLVQSRDLSLLENRRSDGWPWKLLGTHILLPHRKIPLQLAAHQTTNKAT